MAASFSATVVVSPVQRMPIIAWRAKPSCIGSVTATICITPASTMRWTR
jgi:hypothetical protein